MPALLDPTDARPIHFVGIAGAGMSALAELFMLRGVVVTGCDAHPENAPDLALRGIVVEQGHAPNHVTGARALVVTSAMPKDHPELDRARELGLPSCVAPKRSARRRAGRCSSGWREPMASPPPLC